MKVWICEKSNPITKTDLNMSQIRELQENYPLAASSLCTIHTSLPLIVPNTNKEVTHHISES